MRKILWPILIGFVQISFAQVNQDSLSIMESELPTLQLSGLEIEQEGDSEQSDISSLLQGSKDVFMNTAGYTFGAARYKIRGYDTDQSSVFINGIPMNDEESGRVFWGTWGGLNDMMRNKENVYGLNKSQFAFGGIGGSNYINTRASEYKKRIGASYAIANKSYRNRFMLSYTTGMMKNGWAFAASVSKRWATEGYQEGTFYDAYSYFLSLEKKINQKHSLALTVFGAPSERGKSGGSIQEAYDLTNNRYYNPNWGYQNGEKRSAKVATSHRPHAILSHYYQITDKTKVNSSASYAFGSYSTTALNWYNTRDPRPDYYKNLPSYYDDPTANNAAKAAFQNNPQLDWDYFYLINSKSPDGRASYIIEERKTDYSESHFSTVVNHQASDEFFFDGGLNFSYYKGRHYVLVDDLLGADYYLDIDKFGERDFPDDPNMLDNDLYQVDNVRQEGDVISNDYDMNKINGLAWAQFSAKLKRFDLFFALNLSQTMFWRTGHMKNGKFPEDSYGDSEKENFLNYGLKGGLTYKINGKNYLYANAYRGTKAPYIKNAYVSPRTRDYTVDGLSEETISSAEAGYHLRSSNMKARITAYYTQIEDQTQVYSFYNDLHGNYTNQVLTNINQQTMGIELGVENKINSSFTSTIVIAIGDHSFTNRPKGVLIQDNDASQVVNPYTVYQKDFYLSGPQNIYSAGLKYSHPQFWFATLTANFFQKNYLSFDPSRRITAAVSNETGTDQETPGSENWNKIINQEQLKNAFTLDLFARKTWQVNGYFIYLNIGVNNILNNQDFITGGYEQRRFDYTDRNPDKFPSKYFYAYGINYFISLGINL